MSINKLSDTIEEIRAQLTEAEFIGFCKGSALKHLKANEFREAKTYTGVLFTLEATGLIKPVEYIAVYQYPNKDTSYVLKKNKDNCFIGDTDPSKAYVFDSKNAAEKAMPGAKRGWTNDVFPGRNISVVFHKMSADAKN